MVKNLALNKGYKLKSGYVVNLSEMIKIHTYYQIGCTQEFIYENYKVSVQKAWTIAEFVRENMDKYSYTEQEAIEIAKEKMGFEERPSSLFV